MTTIATDGKSLAADSRCSSGSSLVTDDFVKMKRMSNGDLVGCCGHATECHEFLRWFDDPTRDVALKLSDNFRALVLRKSDGLVLEYDENTYWHEAPSRSAIGSGWVWAIAAMDHGCTPLDAVKYAATRDTATGGRIWCLRL